MSPLVILHRVHFVQQLINFPLMSPHNSQLLQTPAPLLRRFLHTAAPCHHEPAQLQTMPPMQGWVCLTQKGFCCILLMELFVL